MSTAGTPVLLTGFADAVSQALAGQLAAQRAIADVRSGTALPDTLLAALDAVLITGERDRLRAFTRELQKTIERGCN